MFISFAGRLKSSSGKQFVNCVGELLAITRAVRQRGEEIRDRLSNICENRACYLLQRLL